MFLEVKNTSTSPTRTQPLPSSTVVTNSSLKSTMNQTASYFSSVMVATSSMFLEVKIMSTNSSHTPTLPSSSVVNNLSLESTMDQTASYFSSSMAATSSMFLEVKNTSTNSSLTPTLQSSSVITNVFLESTMDQTASYFSSSMDASSSRFPVSTISTRIFAQSSTLVGSLYKNRSAFIQILSSTFTPEITDNFKMIIPITSFNTINKTIISTVTTAITNRNDMSTTAFANFSTMPHSSLKKP